MDAYLEQQYVIANELREIPGELRESLGGINEYQVLIKSTVESFEASTKGFMTEVKNHQTTVDTMVSDFKETTEQSTSQAAEYQKTLLEGLENVVSELKEESTGLKTTIRETQDAQDEFAKGLDDTLKEQVQAIINQQQNMVEGLSETVTILRKPQSRTYLKSQNIKKYCLQA